MLVTINVSVIAAGDEHGKCIVFRTVENTIDICNSVQYSGAIILIHNLLHSMKHNSGRHPFSRLQWQVCLRPHHQGTLGLFVQ